MSSLPARPNAGGAQGLPKRPQQYGSNYWPGASAGASTGEKSGSPAKHDDDIDNIIRMAEAGIKPAKIDDAAPTEKKKKDKTRMVFVDTERSPEEILYAQYSGL